MRTLLEVADSDSGVFSFVGHHVKDVFSGEWDRKQPALSSREELKYDSSATSHPPTHETREEWRVTIFIKKKLFLIKFDVYTSIEV